MNNALNPDSAKYSDSEKSTRSILFGKIAADDGLTPDELKGILKADQINIGVVAALLASFAFESFEITTQLTFDTDMAMQIMSSTAILATVVNCTVVALSLFLYRFVDHISDDEIEQVYDVSSGLFSLTLYILLFGMVCLLIEVYVQAHYILE
eukprot:UN28550